MRLLRTRFTVRWLMAAIVVVAVGLCAALRLWDSLVEWAYPPRVQVHSVWSAGTSSNRSEHDIWVEYGGTTRRVVSVYRDHDGDGYIDERLLFSGPMVALYRARNNDGVLDSMREIQPARSEVRLPPGSPETGPFTRAGLDELVRIRPRDPPPGAAR